MHYPTLRLIRKSNRIESNRRLLLKNRSKSIVHLKAGIVTAITFSTSMMFHLNVGDDNDEV